MLRVSLRSVAATAGMRAPVAAPTLASVRYMGGSAELTPTEIEERVIEVVKGTLKVDPSKVTPSSHFVNDLGLDSLDTVEMVMCIEEEFSIQIPDADAEKILTCADAINYIQSNPDAK